MKMKEYGKGGGEGTKRMKDDGAYRAMFVKL
jgi:hypothetical protein